MSMLTNNKYSTFGYYETSVEEQIKGKRPAVENILLIAICQLVQKTSNSQ
jgi:hypothetical protein